MADDATDKASEGNLAQAKAVEKNRLTVGSYERCARSYAESTAPANGARGSAALLQLVAALRAGASILEIGSGPGWDADFLDARGFQVQRTDVTQAFIDLQRERGRKVLPLNIIRDEVGGPYDAAMALYVLQHIDRSLIDAVLLKIACALTAGGALLVTLREGDGNHEEQAESGVYHVVNWSEAEFLSRLRGAGFEVSWVGHSSDSDGDWLSVLARRD